MKRVRLGVIADLHVGAAACSPALRPQGTASDGDAEFVDKLLRLLAEDSIEAEFLICPGDLSNVAEPAEFEVAETVIRKVAAALRVPDERIIAVPGNHDVHWKLLAASPSSTTAQQQQLRFLTMSTTGKLGPQWKSTAPRLYEPPFVELLDFPDAVILSFTTSAHDSEDELLHFGRVTEAALQAAKKLLTALPDDERPRILLLHHHPVIWDTPGSDKPDPSVLVNAEQLLNLAHTNRFDFLIHGHKHHPRFRVLSHDGLHPLVILCAGTFSRRIDTDAAGVSANQFHFLDLESRNAKTGLVAGKLTSWAWVPGLRKWIPSEERSRGIGHIEVFGAYMLEATLTELVEPLIADILAKKTHCYWRELYAFDENFKYCGKRLVKHVLTGIGLKFDCRVHSDELNDLLLVKN